MNLSPGDFLGGMAAASARRAAAARAREPEAALRRRALETAPPPALELAGFDVIAEIKRVSPARGVLTGHGPQRVGERAAAYARAGAAAVSVLTEPTRFGGALAHLAAAGRALAACEHRVPAMRKDFLVDPYQVLEARAAGAGGVLVIATMLDPARCGELVDAARECGLFVLLEAFGADDLAAASRFAGRGVLLGLNARDLRTLEIDPGRHAALARAFPAGSIRVAESGLSGPDDVARVAAAGYRLALVGEALMRSDDPALALSALLRAGRAACASV